ncbi:MAG: PAS domain-containing sensor histidine kinase [Candidatus Coprenecus sp.]|nr:PAS domain-containing sensor histidine kinase [Candidatus Coprenecus sp.]
MFGQKLLECSEVGLWVMEIDEGKRRRLYVNSVMAGLLQCPQGLSPEDVYDFWNRGVKGDSQALVQENLKRMIEGKHSEVKYMWNHPDGNRRIVRCSGKRDYSYTGGLRFSGLHRDVTNVTHVDQESQLKDILLKSYYNFYTSKKALTVFLVNLDKDTFIPLKENNQQEGGCFSEYITDYAAKMTNEYAVSKVNTFKDFKFIKAYLESSPVYKVLVQHIDSEGESAWYRLSASRINSNDIIFSIEDRTSVMLGDIVKETILNNLIGGFLLNLKSNHVSKIKLSPFFSYLDDYSDNLTIRRGVELLCPHIDKDYVDGWLDFTSDKNIKKVYERKIRTDFSFQAIYSGEHTWIRSSMFPVGRDLCEDPSVVLVFRKYSKEELDNVYYTADIEHQKEIIESEFRLIHGLAHQYITLKVVRMNGDFSVVYKDFDPIYGWNKGEHDNFWESYRELISSHCHPDDKENMIRFANASEVSSALKGRRRHVERFRLRRTDDSYIWVNLVLIRYDHQLDTELTEFAYSLADIDENVKREIEYMQAIQEAQISKEESRLKTQFVNNISHDIRTPLNAVVGYSQLLAQASDIITESERMEYMKYIESSGELLTMLIDDILSISDIEHDILRINPQLCSCNTICDKAVSCCMMRTPVGVNMYYQSEFEDNYCIRTDQKRVQQILINMISNSCKATVRGEIWVDCRRSDKPGFIDFVVTDTGTGVNPEKAKEIFNRFVTIDENNTGHGLGLDICMKISKRMGGEIWLDQEYKNGARFVLTLPSNI